MLYCLPVGSEYEDNHSSLSIAMAFNWINALLRGVTLTAVRTHVVMLMERLKMRHTAQVFIFYKYFDIGLFTSVYIMISVLQVVPISLSKQVCVIFIC